MFCRKCRKVIEDENAKFCRECGTPVLFHIYEHKSNRFSIKQVLTYTSKKKNIIFILFFVVFLLMVTLAYCYFINYDDNSKTINNLQLELYERQESSYAYELETSQEYTTDFNSETEQEYVGKFNLETETSNMEVKEEYSIAMEIETEPTTDESKTKRFIICKGAVTWNEAKELCEERGGHLAYIKSSDEYDSIISYLEDTELKYLWVGATTTISGDNVEARWTDGDSLDFIYDNNLWYDGEPSGRDLQSEDKTIEPYIMLWNIQDKWSFNDSSDIAVNIYKKERFGYICEIDE